MTIVSRYIFRQAVSALLLILLSLSGVVWIALALKQLKVVTSTGSSAIQLLALTTLALPNLMALIAPVALLVATIHLLNRLNSDSELIILSASGGTMWQAARPLLVVALLVATGVAFVNHAVLPWTLRQLRIQVVSMRSDLLSQVLQPGSFTAAENGKVTIHIRDRRADGELIGILMHDTREPKQQLSYLAERGVVMREGAQSFLLMQDGHVLRRATPTTPPEILAFQTYAIDLDSFDRKQGPMEWGPRELYTVELMALASTVKGDKLKLGPIQAELYERLSSPLYPFAFVFIALAFVGQSQSTRTSRVQATTSGLLAAVAIRIGGLGLNNVVATNPAVAPLLFAIPIVASAASIGVMYRNAYPRPGYGVIARTTDAIGDAIQAVIRRIKTRVSKTDDASAARR